MQRGNRADDVLQRADLFPKLRHSVHTMSGGVLSICAVVLMAILFFHETARWLSPERVEHLSLDSASVTSRQPIHFDISFPHLPCELLSVDVIDTLGETSLHIDHDITKLHIGEAAYGGRTKYVPGQVLDEALVRARKQAHDQVVASHNSTYCGDCYGALPAGTCCNTCNDVRKAYGAKQWNFKAAEIEQCREENAVHDAAMKRAKSGKRGCRIEGTLGVHRVAGMLRFVPSDTFSSSHGEEHAFSAIEKGYFDSSHEVHALDFGDAQVLRKAGVPESPLKGAKRDDGQNGVIFHYFAKVVPTVVPGAFGAPVKTNQFSATQFRTHVRDQPGRTLPGVFVSYDFSPVSVTIASARSSFLHYVTQLCAILGGTFALFQLLDRVVHGLRRRHHLHLRHKGGYSRL